PPNCPVYQKWPGPVARGFPAQDRSSLDARDFPGSGAQGHHPRRSPRPRTMAAPMTELSVSPTSTPVDTHGRPLRDLRISVTDRCNFRCVYCMPRDTFGPDHAFLPRAEILTFEEITRLAGVFTSLGVSK